MRTVQEIKEQILNRIGKIQNSVSKEFLEFIKTKLNIDGFIQNSSNLLCSRLSGNNEFLRFSYASDSAKNLYIP